MGEAFVVKFVFKFEGVAVSQNRDDPKEKEN